MTANLSWTAPGGSNSSNQIIRYRIPSQTSTWTVFNTVGPTVATATITGLLDNYIYEFQIVNNCLVGGPSPSVSSFKIKMVCPSVTLTKTYNSVNYSFSHIGLDIKSYIVEILDSTGNSVINNTVVSTPASTVTGSFTGLQGNTTYQIRVTMFAGVSNEYSKYCSSTSFTTDATPTCDAPTALNVTIS